MKPRTIFHLCIRLLGLLFLYHGLQAVPAAIARIIASFPHKLVPGVTQDMIPQEFLAGIFMAGWPLLVAIWLLKGAPYLMELAYPGGATSPEEAGQPLAGPDRKLNA